MATTGPKRVYGGVSAEQRQGARREQLLSAGLQELGTAGWKATSVRTICQEARLNQRYFYESFSGLDELLVAVFDRIVDEMIAAVAEAIQQAPPTYLDQARALVGAVVATATDDPRKGRVAFIGAPSNQALMRRRLERMHGEIADGLALFALHHPTGLDATSAKLNAHLLAGGLIQAMVAWLQGRLDVDRDRLIDHYAAAVVAVSGIASQDQHSPSPATMNPGAVS